MKIIFTHLIGRFLVVMFCGVLTSQVAHSNETYTSEHQVKKDHFVLVALGDSISTGFNAGAPLDQKHMSWTTGNDFFKRVSSHHYRLKNYFDQKNIRTVNVAIAGSKTNRLVQQAEAAMQKVVPDYVTILMGANDLCNYTSETFEEKLREAQDTFHKVVESFIETNPDVKILVSSIPNMFHLYEIGSTRRGCQNTWRTLGICKKMLHPDSTNVERFEFHYWWSEFNKVLEELESRYPYNVRFIDEVMNYKFSTSMISWIDCFHPSIEGQNVLSRIAWDSGFFD